MEIQASSRVCCVTGQPLTPGTQYVGVLFERDGQLIREDTHRTAWVGPPEGAIAYWFGKVPTAIQSRKPVVNEALLFDCFDHLSESDIPAKRNFRYVVALLLMRKKKLKFEDVRVTDEGDVLILKDTRTGQQVAVHDPHLSEAEMASVQDEVFTVLGWN